MSARTRSRRQMDGALAGGTLALLPDGLACLRCGHTWTPRVPAPVRCPRCCSTTWHTPRQTKQP